MMGWVGCAERGNVEFIKWGLAHGIVPEERDEPLHGSVPWLCLEAALRHGHAELIGVLASHPALAPCLPPGDLEWGKGLRRMCLLVAAGSVTPAVRATMWEALEGRARSEGWEWREHEAAAIAALTPKQAAKVLKAPEAVTV
jgi:hypothetical protein